MGFETMENHFMNTVGKAMKYVRLVDSSYLKVYPDAGNITNAGVKLQQDVCEDMLLAGNMIALHLKETRPGVFREVPFLTGHVDFEAIIHICGIWESVVMLQNYGMWDRMIGRKPYALQTRVCGVSWINRVRWRIGRLYEVSKESNF